MMTPAKTVASNSKNPPKSKARLKYGSGYKGLALAICYGNRDRLRKQFGI